MRPIPTCLHKKSHALSDSSTTSCAVAKHNDINNCIMLKNPTETLQRSVWAGPNLEYRFNSSDDVIQGCKVAVVKTAAPNQLPHAFNRVKFRAVGREKMQAKMTCNFPAPRLMQA